MGVLIDCHIHTARCGHAIGRVDEYAAAAYRKGLYGIAFTEHLALPPELDPDRNLSMREDDLQEYLDEIDTARLRFPDLEIVAGIEADYLPGRTDETAQAIADARALSNGVRFVLGSVHFIGEWVFDDPGRIEEWDRRNVDRAWEAYFSLWGQAAGSGMFDVMAHPDLIKKFGHRPSTDPTELYETAAAAAAEAGVAIEVSTAGLRKPVGELYPGIDLLRAFHAAGVPATVGSDAHAPDEVGYRIDAAYAALIEAGYEAVRFPDGSGGWRSIEL